MAWNEPGGNKDPWSRKPKGNSEVDKLINDAQSHENLAQMYIGWCPFW